jgi:NIPSNAP
MIYELRVYSCLPNRLSKLLKRFEEHTLKIWEKHGIRQAGFWTVLVGDGNNDLHYLLAWESLAEREKVWEAFLADRRGSKRATTASATDRSLPTSKACSLSPPHSPRCSSRA